MQGVGNKPACADVLAGRKTVGTIRGTVVYAGHKPSRSFLRRYTGYVEQFGELSLPPFCLPPQGLHEDLAQALAVLQIILHGPQAFQCTFTFVVPLTYTNAAVHSCKYMRRYSASQPSSQESDGRHSA